jgi:SAM-dependent methyltransferase
MTKPEDRYNRIAQYYDTLVSQYGHDPKACDYGHSASQQIKFSVLSKVICGKEKTLLDIGCGFADFADFLSLQHPKLQYTGYDLSPQMIKNAQNIHPGLPLYQKNILESPPDTSFDIVTANGIFYLLGDNAFGIMKKIITAMYASSNIAIAFNSLSSWTQDKEENEFYADPLETLAFCRTLSPWVVLRHDYHPRDFTIYLYKQNN